MVPMAIRAGVFGLGLLQEACWDICLEAAQTPTVVHTIILITEAGGLDGDQDGGQTMVPAGAQDGVPVQVQFTGSVY